MNTPDPKITRQIQDWLACPASSRDLMAGASLLFTLNRNRAMFGTISRMPAKYASRIERELKKHLRIRLDGLTPPEIIKKEAVVMPRVQATIDSSAEFATAKVAKGKRTDHDTLPPAIQKLWDDNTLRIRKISLLFNELKAMADAAPCDRYERLTALAEADETYRFNMQRYDNFTPGDDEPMRSIGSDVPENRLLPNARKNLTAARKRLAKLEPGTLSYTDTVADIYRHARTITELGGKFSAKTSAELKALNIILD